MCSEADLLALLIIRARGARAPFTVVGELSGTAFVGGVLECLACLSFGTWQCQRPMRPACTQAASFGNNRHGQSRHERRARRTAAYKANMEAAASSVALNSQAPPAGAESLWVAQDCGACAGLRHRARRCPRALCALCCKAQSGGGCEWHLANTF